MRWLPAAAALTAIVFLVPAASAAPPSITYSCTPAPVDCFEWHKSDVTLQFNVSGTGLVAVSGCEDRVVTADTVGTPFECYARNSAGEENRVTAVVRRDATPPAVSPVPARGADSNGWYNHGFSVAFTGTDATSGVASCTPSASYGGADTANGSLGGTCTDNAGNTAAGTFSFKYDATPPAVSGATVRDADANGWYNHALSGSFQGADGTSGIASCTPVAYSGPDTSSGSLAGTCTDVAGNTSAAGTFAFRYDATPPAVTGAALSRPPDSGDWYRKPVRVAFSGSDGASGIESCTATDFSGPDGAATVRGTCRDRAGNVSSEGSAAFKYDATAPELRSVETKRGRGFVQLQWQASPDTAAVQVDRTPGAGRAARTTLFRGKASSFRDARVARNRRYRYVVTALDEAGNAASRTATVFVRPALFRPVNGARVRGRVLLAWEPVARAAYYNVQVFRGKRKVLTLWPGKPFLRLPRLAPGRYRWYVFPGFRARSARSYGKLIGFSEFVVTP